LKLRLFDTLPKKLAGLVPVVALLLALYIAWPQIFPPPQLTAEQIDWVESQQTAGHFYDITQHLTYVGANPDGSGLYRGYLTHGGVTYISTTSVYRDQSRADTGFSDKVNFLRQGGFQGWRSSITYSHPHWQGQKRVYNGGAAYVVLGYVDENTFGKTPVVTVTWAS
jgi:hypothetical protein